jgi:hypothetical protein
MSITLSSTAATRVGQCLRLLGSDKPGEVLAAVDALERTLRGAGTDLHFLANVAELALRNKPEPKRTPPPPPRSSPDDDIATVIKFCAGFDVRPELSEKEQDFITNLVRWSREEGDGLELTEKQEKWLSDIHRRILKQRGWL